MRAAPITVPSTLGRLAPKTAKPVSVAATASSRYGSPTDTSPRPSLEDSRIAPTAAHNPDMTYASARYRPTRMPASRAATGLPPIAYSERPHRVCSRKT
jgi:hypothetical protein